MTNAFLHGGVIHLLFNMWALWVFGPAVEDRFGARKFLTYYLLTAFFASLAHAALNPASQIPALGASGAISGVIGAYVRMFPMSRLVMVVPVLIFPFFFEISAAGFAAIWIIMQIIPGIASLMLPPDAGGVAWWAHLGGFAAGWLLTPVMRRPAPAYRRFFSDEGVYGFFPDGGRFRGGGVWR
ncbi:rhomboid family intramembrane serine protease [Hyphococcus sp.]|uniref:rhomboid family intramembrane serine protease n=1 Tax=Hyphococcus sp. TaxID=2038636 RepID=UPI003D134615